jgi:hypothetical protein
MSLSTARAGLPERVPLHWRRTVDGPRLRRAERQWTVWTFAHITPFVAGAVLLVLFKPILAPISVILLIHGWALGELWANRGAVVVRNQSRLGAGPDAQALLLLGDLVDDANRTLHAETGLVLQPGEFGTWIVGEAGALLVRPNRRRVDCFCVRATGTDLPHGDRVAHLLLALRCGEADFTTVANLAFSGARWRVRRRLRPHQRAALDAVTPVAC